MKKYFLYALLAFATMTFVACDKNKDKNNPDDPTEESEDINENGIQNEFGSGRLIIGSWDVTRGAYHFTFRSDGTCLQNGYSYESGIWSYNPETRILATTMGSWSWSMNIISAEALQGTYITKGTSYGFTHDGIYVDANDKLIVGKWKTKEGKEIIFDGKKCSLNGGTKVTYKITRENPGNDDPNATIIFNNEIEINLYHLSGGYLRIGSDSNTEAYAGYYYYVTE